MTYVLKTVAALGDSLTYAMTNAAKTDRSSTSHVAYAEMVSSDFLLAPPAFNFGVSGETTAQIALRTGAVRAAAPDICVIMAGMNDYTSGTAGTAATLAAAIIAIAADLKNGSPSIEPVIVTLPKASAIGSTQEVRRRAVNEILRKQTLYRVADAALIADTMGQPDFDVIGWSYDGTHYEVAVYEIIGHAIAGCLEDMRDTFACTKGLSSCLIGAMTGTGGSLSGTASGEVATGWVCANLNAKVNRFTGRVDESGTALIVSNFQTLASMGLSIGNTILAEFDVMITSRHIHQVYAYMLFYNGAAILGDGEFAFNRQAGTVKPLPVLAGTMRIGPVVIPATATQLTMAITVQGPTSTIAPGFVDILINRAAIRTL